MLINIALAGPLAAQAAHAKPAKAAVKSPPTPSPTPTPTPTPTPVAAKAVDAAPDQPHAHPIGNPAAWFPADSYPPAARSAGQEGRTAFSVKVDAQGRVLECDVVQSSGSVILDNTTCDLVVSNGRFNPARDATGKPVDGTWQSAMRWQLVVTEPSFEDGDR